MPDTDAFGSLAGSVSGGKVQSFDKDGYSSAKLRNRYLRSAGEEWKEDELEDNSINEFDECSRKLLFSLNVDHGRWLPVCLSTRREGIIAIL